MLSAGEPLGERDRADASGLLRAHQRNLKKTPYLLPNIMYDKRCAGLVFTKIE